MICRVWRVPRSSVYVERSRATATAGPAMKRGPKTLLSDEELVEQIRVVITESPFHGEGHRKVRARLIKRGTYAGKNRVLRLMRDNGLLAPTRIGHRHGDRSHSGTITTTRPDELWGTDATVFYAGKDGWCWFFGAIDHATDEIVGWKTAKRGDRWAALEPIHQGVRYAFGAFAKDIARGLKVRSDWGPQYTSYAFGGDLAWLGIQHSPSFVGEPECNGVIERFMRTLKEQCIWIHRFEDLEHATREIAAFIERYNNKWLIERHGHRTPREMRSAMLAEAA
jgi:transposase InsO family protein